MLNLILITEIKIWPNTWFQLNQVYEYIKQNKVIDNWLNLIIFFEIYTFIVYTLRINKLLWLSISLLLVHFTSKNASISMIFRLSTLINNNNNKMFQQNTHSSLNTNVRDVHSNTSTRFRQYHIQSSNASNMFIL